MSEAIALGRLGGPGPVNAHSMSHCRHVRMARCQRRRFVFGLDQRIRCAYDQRSHTRWSGTIPWLTRVGVRGNGGRVGSIDVPLLGLGRQSVREAKIVSPTGREV